MVQQAAERIERPAPGHYQSRLRAALSRHPVSSAPWRDEPYAPSRRPQRPRPAARRIGQLALPLEV